MGRVLPVWQAPALQRLPQVPDPVAPAPGLLAVGAQAVLEEQ